MEYLRTLTSPKKNIILFVISNVTAIVIMYGKRHRYFIYEGTNMSQNPMILVTRKATIEQGVWLLYYWAFGYQSGMH